jgi:hypothetical protein
VFYAYNENEDGDEHVEQALEVVGEGNEWEDIDNGDKDEDEDEDG